MEKSIESESAPSKPQVVAGGDYLDRLFDIFEGLKIEADYRRICLDDWSGWIDLPDKSGWWLVVMDWESHSEIVEVTDGIITNDCYWEDCEIVARGVGDGETVSGRWLFLANVPDELPR